MILPLNERLSHNAVSGCKIARIHMMKASLSRPVKGEPAQTRLEVVSDILLRVDY
jgi:hypothetical protein